MKPIVFLLHGFNIFDGGKSTMGKLVPFLETDGFETHEMTYGYFGLLSTRFLNDNVARDLAARVLRSQLLWPNRSIVVMGHSNGCTIIHLAAKLYGMEVEKAVFLMPALVHTTARSPKIAQRLVFHSMGDWPTRWSRWLPSAEFRPWGSMGHSGFFGSDHGTENYDVEALWNGREVIDYSTRFGHSTMFEDTFIEYFADFIGDNIRW